MRLALHQECTQQSQAIRDGVLPNWRLRLPTLIVTQTHGGEEEERQQRHRQRWTRHGCDNAYVLTRFVRVSDYNRRQSLKALTKMT